MFMTVQDDDKAEILVLIDDPAAPEIYADETSGFALLNGTVAITLEAARWDHGPSLNTVHLGVRAPYITDRAFWD